MAAPTRLPISPPISAPATPPATFDPVPPPVTAAPMAAPLKAPTAVPVFSFGPVPVCGLPAQPTTPRATIAAVTILPVVIVSPSRRADVDALAPVAGREDWGKTLSRCNQLHR